MKDRFRNTGVIPVVVLNDDNNAVNLVRAMYEGGIDIAEVTFRTEAAASSIKKISEEVPEVLVGAGTIINLEQCKRAIEVGAKFIVCPGISEDVIRYCQEHDVLVIPGCVTPSEIMKCLELGVDTVKFFPASSFGGLKTIKALAAPFKQVKFMPTGGISTANLEEYLSCEAILACGGSWICADKLVEEGKFNEISELCKEARKIVNNCRG